MTPIEIIGQAIGIVAMACNIISFQQKRQSYLIALQMMGGALFSISFFMLGAIVGGILNIVAAMRAVIFLFERRLRATHPAWLCGFIALYVALYVLTFTVFATFTAFGKEPTPANLIIEVLPIVGMTASSIGYMLASSRAVRRLGLVSSPAWLTYNICYVSVGAIICEVISLGSIFIGMYRHDRKSK